MHPAWKLHAAPGARPRPHDRGRAAERRARGAAAALGGATRAARGPARRATLYADRDLVPGVDGRDRRRHLAGGRDARPRAVARLPAPARAAPADLRRPPARPRLAVLRHRLHAGPGRRVPALAGRHRRARRPPRARRPRPPVHRRPGPHPGQPRSDRDATSTPSARRWPTGEKTAYEVARAVYGEQFTEEMASWQMTMTTAWLTHLERSGEVRQDRRRPSSAGAWPHKLPAMRIDERIASGAEPAFSFEFFPPKTDEGEANLADALTELARLEPTFVSVTYGAGGTPAQRGKTIDIVSRIKADHGLEAMAHFTCVGAIGRRAARGAGPDARRRHRERARAARRPARGRRRERVGRGRRRPALLARADRADPRRLRLRGRRRVLPGGPHSRPSRPSPTSSTPARRSTRARSS